jgi:hypothetical protein
VSGREFDYSCALKHEKAFGRRQESVGVPPDSRVERSRKVIGSADVLDQQLYPQRASRTLQFLYLRRRNGVHEIRQHQHARDPRHGLLQQFETLASKPGGHDRLPGDISPRSGEARDEPGADRVAERDHDNRDRAGCVFCGLGGWSGGYDDDARFEPQAFDCESGKPLTLPIRGQVVDRDSPPIHVPKFTQALEEWVKSVSLCRTWI